MVTLARSRSNLLPSAVPCFYLSLLDKAGCTRQPIAQRGGFREEDFQFLAH